MNTTNTKKMLMIMISILAMGALSGCEKETKDTTNNYILPEGLQDCKIYNMRNTGGSNITVVRCPLSATSTTYSSGKTTASAMVVEQAPAQAASQTQTKASDEVEINGETYRKTESMKEIQINGESYKKVQ